MKAITIWQPWAYLLCMGKKRFETRSWSTVIRGRMAIHAGVSKQGINNLMDAYMWGGENIEEFEAEVGPCGVWKRLPYGAVVGTGNLVACHKITPSFAGRLDAREIKFGDYSIGRFAWEFDSPIMFEKPIPARGRYGIWEWEERTE